MVTSHLFYSVHKHLVSTVLLVICVRKSPHLGQALTPINKTLLPSWSQQLSNPYGVNLSSRRCMGNSPVSKASKTIQSALTPLHPQHPTPTTQTHTLHPPNRNESRYDLEYTWSCCMGGLKAPPLWWMTNKVLCFDIYFYRELIPSCYYEAIQVVSHVLAHLVIN